MPINWLVGECNDVEGTLRLLHQNAEAVAGLTQVFTPSEAVRLNALGDKLRDRINAVARQRKSPLQATGVGSLIGVHFARRPIRTPADTHPHDPAIEKILLDLHKLFHLE